jgi:hypothetical protein
MSESFLEEKKGVGFEATSFHKIVMIEAAKILDGLMQTLYYPPYRGIFTDSYINPVLYIPNLELV